MISLAIKYLTFHGYLVITPEEQEEEEPPADFGKDSEPLIYDFESSYLAEAYREGFWDGQQVGN